MMIKVIAKESATLHDARRYYLPGPVLGPQTRPCTLGSRIPSHVSSRSPPSFSTLSPDYHSQAHNAICPIYSDECFTPSTPESHCRFTKADTYDTGGTFRKPGVAVAAPKSRFRILLTILPQSRIADKLLA